MADRMKRALYVTFQVIGFVGVLVLLCMGSLLIVGLDMNSKAQRVAIAKQLDVSIEEYEGLLYKYNSAGISDQAINAALFSVKEQLDREKARLITEEPPHLGLQRTYSR
jgi:hypothetical protein